MRRSKPIAAWALVLGALLPGCGPRREEQTVAKPTFEPPWSVTVHDGSNNRYRFWRESAAEPPRFEYVPVRPEQSSSGSYSGGEPASGTLAPDQVEALWRWVVRLESIGSPAGPRRMGTVAVTVDDGRGRRSLVVSDPAAVLDELRAFLARYRSPGGA